MTMAEKILAAKSGKSSVTPGEIVDAYPDLVMGYTANVAVGQRFTAHRFTLLYDPDRLAIRLDHISSEREDREVRGVDQQICRNFARAHGSPEVLRCRLQALPTWSLMEVGDVLAWRLDRRHAAVAQNYPGQPGRTSNRHRLYRSYVPCDHVGRLRMKVPETFKIGLNGQFPPGVYAKDLMLHLIGKLGADGCGYHVSVELYKVILASI